MPESAKEDVQITALIKGILNGYPGNSAIFREYLQNSDDAKATSQTFILDEKQYSLDSIVDPALKATQGAALIAVNDGILRDADWKALRTIHSSSKKTDETQTGKNGLGFRASYHLTENPHVLSGNKLMILDAHHEFQQHPGGVVIDVVKEGPAYCDQLAPFIPVVQDPFQYYNGTAFRLPLRTLEQAQRSKIKETPTYVDDIRDLLFAFASNELEQVILFLKHIKTIVIYHIDKDGAKSLLGKVSVEQVPSVDGIDSRRITVERPDLNKHVRLWYFQHLSVDKVEATRTMTDRLGYDVGECLTDDKLTPTVDLAIPTEGEILGGLYNLLPLPIRTGFPVHLNAVFALTPDRQSLKNIQEVGLHRSRERRLVEWNRVILDVFAPTIWADMLETLAPKLGTAASWSVWPPQARDSESYWANLAAKLTQEVISRKLAIFPTIPHLGQSSLISLEDSHALVASTHPTVSLKALAAFGLKIVQPPAHIYDILRSGSIKFPSPFLSPQTLHQVLSAGYLLGSWRLHDPTTTPDIIEYLVFSASSPNYSHLIGLPWFSLADGSPIALHPAHHTPRHIVPASEEEARLFSGHPHMLSWTCMPAKLRTSLRRPEAANALNVMCLSPADVVSVLRTASDIAWIINFWKWLEQWPQRPQFFQRKDNISMLHLLPTADGTLKRLSDRIVSLEDTEQSAVKAWNKLGVYGFHQDVPDRVVSMLVTESFAECPRTTRYVPLLLDTCDMRGSSSLSPTDFDALSDSVYRGLPNFSRVQLTDKQKAIFEKLPIFDVRKVLKGPPALNSVSGTRIHVTPNDDAPLPVLERYPPVIYVDVREPKTKCLITLLEPVKIQNLYDLLLLAVQNWAIQPTNLQEAFVDQIFDNWNRLPNHLRQTLKDLPFVTVEGMATRVSPKGLVDPGSDLTRLYIGEAGRIPCGRFASRAYITIMQSLGFFPSTLNHEILEERLRYLSTVSNDSHAFQKATYFVNALNRLWRNDFHKLVEQYCATRWLPLSKPSALVSPKDCRDTYPGENAHRYYYDLVLKVLPEDNIQITSRGFRSALGWADAVPVDVLLHQLRLTLDRPRDRDRNERLLKLIDYLSQLHDNHGVPSDVLATMRAVVDDRPWIPVSSRTSNEVVLSKYALLSEIDLRPPFRQVLQPRYPAFLHEMGCTQRPTLETLVQELNKYQVLSTLDARAAISLLQEIAGYHPDFDKTTLRIPGNDGHSHPFENIYYPDRDDLYHSEALADKVAAHNQISRALAEKLGIPTLSSMMLQFGDDDSDDEEQMSEDLVGRIRGFLREYDVRYAFNEFLANADDAKAQKFSILLDTSRQLAGDSTPGVISPEFQSLHRCASLVLYNNRTLSEADYSGLRRVGQGGKLGQEDTHGRHGLGALSLYYFTDVAIVISGEYVMILDPSARYLPSRHGRKRTALKRTLTEIVRRYPDQLRPYHGLFNFSSDTKTYNGTLFCLPLKSTICEKPCDPTTARSLIKTAYKDLAQNAFFFTGLEEISATLRRYSDQRLWSMAATRSTIDQLGDGLTRQEIRIRRQSQFGSIEPEDWLITTSRKERIPSIHQSTAAGLKLRSESPMVVQIAVRMSRNEFGSADPYLFSTLRLPKTTSLPFHLNSRFAISSNRQSIVFTPPDSQKQRDSKSAFNAWILDSVVPPLYLATLAYLIKYEDRKAPRRFNDQQWWLLQSRDELSKHISDAFLNILPNTMQPLFDTVDHRLVTFGEAVFSRDEPREVKELLKLVEAPGLITAYRHSTLLLRVPTKIVDCRYLKDVLINHTSLTCMQSFYTTKKFGAKDIFAILAYLKDEAPLVGLPLLLLSTELLVAIPGVRDCPIYVSANATFAAKHAALFLSANFLSAHYERTTIDCLIKDQSVNVVELTADNVVGLIKSELDRLPDDEARKPLLKRFWDAYKTLPGPPSLEKLDDVGCKLVQGLSRNLSLRECQPHEVVFFRNLSSDNLWLSPILQTLGIDVLDIDVNTILGEYLSKRFPSDTVVNVLKCMETRGITHLDPLPEIEKERYSAWIREGIRFPIYGWHCNDPGIQRSFLLQLPIWKAWSHPGEQLYSGSSLEVLPSNFSLSAIKGYLLPLRIVATYSEHLVQFLSYCHYRKAEASSTECMSAFQIMSAIHLPVRLTTETEMQRFKEFLRCMLQFQANGLRNLTSLNVPDRDGILRSWGSLYDDTIPLFAQTLEYTDTSSFMHPSLRGTISTFTARELGLNHEITIDTFRVCAEAVQRALGSHLQYDRPNRHAILEMARVAYGYYKDRLPALIMVNRATWNSLHGITFIRRHDSRRRGASYVVEPYCGDVLPLLLPPSRLVRQSFEPIAWTQRALFFEEPDEQILAVNKELGMPEVQEVVEHLKILALQIGRDHPGDSTLLSDLKATYAWLNDHAEEAREYLALTAHQELFLNVDDPAYDIWDGKWVAGENLVLNLQYDYGKRKHVNGFLQGYDKLLRAAGCGTIKLFERDSHPPEPSGSMLQNLRTVFNEMRIKCELTDMVFVNPDYQVDFDRDASVLRAHRAFLAAAIPHFRDGDEGWGDSQGQVRFYGSTFGAKALLDFIYTGDFQHTMPRDDEKDYMSLLRDLLELFPVADRWDIPELKAKIEWDIVNKYNMIQRFPHAYQIMLTEADKYDASKLRDALHEFKTCNEEYVDLTNEGDEEEI